MLEQQQTGSASAVAVNNLGNVQGALGRWADALQSYQQAAEDPEMASIAGANYALAAWETGQDDLAIKAARSLLRRCVLVHLGTGCILGVQKVVLKQSRAIRLAGCLMGTCCHQLLVRSMGDENVSADGVILSIARKPY